MHDEPDDARLGEAGLEGAGPGEEQLEAELRDLAARIDPVPDRLLQAAVGAYAWRTVDADLAALVFDSLAESGDVVPVRGRQPERLLSFQASGLSIELEVTAAGRSRRLIGQLVPPRRAVVEIRQAGDVVTIPTDEYGRFTAESLPPGPVSLRCAPAAGEGGPAVVTDWVPI